MIILGMIDFSICPFISLFGYFQTKMAAVSVVINNFFSLFFLEFHFCIECDYTHAKKCSFIFFFNE